MKGRHFLARHFSQQNRLLLAATPYLVNMEAHAAGTHSDWNSLTWHTCRATVGQANPVDSDRPVGHTAAFPGRSDYAAQTPQRKALPVSCTLQIWWGRARDSMCSWMWETAVVLRSLVW